MTCLPSPGIRYASSAHLDESAMTHLAALLTGREVAQRLAVARPLPRRSSRAKNPRESAAQRAGGDTAYVTTITYAVAI